MTSIWVQSPARPGSFEEGAARAPILLVPRGYGLACKGAPPCKAGSARKCSYEWCQMFGLTVALPLNLKLSCWSCHDRAPSWRPPRRGHGRHQLQLRFALSLYGPAMAQRVRALALYHRILRTCRDCTFCPLLVSVVWCCLSCLCPLVSLACPGFHPPFPHLAQPLVVVPHPSCTSPFPWLPLLPRLPPLWPALPRLPRPSSPWPPPLRPPGSPPSPPPPSPFGCHRCRGWRFRSRRYGDYCGRRPRDCCHHRPWGRLPPLLPSWLCSAGCADHFLSFYVALLACTFLVLVLLDLSGDWPLPREGPRGGR